MSPWNICIELVYPIRIEVSLYIPSGVWNVIKSFDWLTSTHWSNPTKRLNIPYYPQPPNNSMYCSIIGGMLLSVTWHFYLLLFLLFDLCLTSRYFHYFHLPCLYFLLWSFQIYFIFLSSVFCSVHTLIHHSLTSVFHILPYVFLFRFYYYLSTICPLILAFPFQPWQLDIPFLVTLWVIFLHSPYYTIGHITPSLVV